MDPLIFTFLVFPPGFIGLWLFVCAFLSWLGGWSRIAERYPLARSVEGEKYSFCTARIGSFPQTASYRNCLSAVVAKEGLQLAVFAPFRFRHPPIFIPWREMNSVIAQSEFLFLRSAVIDLGSSLGSVRLYGKLARAVLERNPNPGPAATPIVERIR